MHEQIDSSDDVDEPENYLDHRAAATMRADAVDNLSYPIEDGRPSDDERDDNAELPRSQHGDDSQRDHQHAECNGPTGGALYAAKNCFSHSSSTCGRRQKRIAGARLNNYSKPER